MERDKPMDDIDPFSVFGSFNKGISNERRIRILTAIAKEFGIKETVPSDFDGIPVLNNLKSFFFAFKDDPRRGERDIDNLWELFRFAIEYADRPNEQSRSYFSIHYDPVLKQSIIRWNITMGLFWIRPYAYINLDERNRKYLAMQQAFPPVGIVVSEKLKSVPSSKDYLWIIDECKKAMEHPQCKIKSFVELSDAAWKATTSVPPVSPSTDEKYWPALEEFNPNITKDDWKRFILEVELPNHPDPMKMLKGLMLLGGEATCKKLAAEYGGLPSRYVGCSVNLGKRAKKYFSLPTFMDGDQERFFVYPFLGRRVEENGVMNYSYRIRPALMDALQEIDLSAISPYASEEEQTMTDVGLNTILYGPPGTGKTYHTVIYAVAIIENRELASVEAESYSDVLTRYNNYKAQGRIEFTTFHQSFGYEEFIEGIRPVVSGDDETSDVGDVQYSVQSGIFKRFCERAERPAAVVTNDYGFGENPSIWKVSLDGTGDNPIRSECLKKGHIRIGWDEYGESITDTTDFSQYGGRVVLNSFINRMQIGDIVLSCYSASTIDAIGVVTGDCEWHDEYPRLKRLRKVNWIVKDIKENILSLNGGTSMTLASVYRMGNVSLTDVYQLMDKHNPTATVEQPAQKNYVFIIDEINRGNISKIFGELITLIEESKRVGKPEGMTARLPNSQKPFGVPDNVYIIGTMNTADRSIATIDTALRRRFLFREMLPNPQVLADVMVEDLSISAMLSRMNQRIAVLYDREHTIGHTYFMKLRDNPTVETLAEIFRNNIIPLLQEYFYEDYEKIRLVLGDPQKTDPEEQFITACENDYAALFGSVDIGLDDSNTYEINDKAFGNIESYRSI
ncbi:MAG: AAA family ATPase [Clostridia bacterium]|nr:AAA family ATPase [Clostridia bacterium]